MTYSDWLVLFGLFAAYVIVARMSYRNSDLTKCSKTMQLRVVKSRDTKVNYFSDDATCPSCERDNVLFAPKAEGVVEHHWCPHCRVCFVDPSRKLFKAPMAVRKEAA